jgi:hypothetical protein
VNIISMIGKIVDVNDLGYALVKRLTISSGNAEVEVEVPVRVLQEANFYAVKDRDVEFEVSHEVGDLDKWQIVMSGEVYLKNEKEKLVFSSLGGLRLAIKSEEFYRDLKVGDKIYFKLRSV